MLCLLDLPVSLFIKKEMIEQALDFIDEMYASGLKVLIHCVAGRSRSPSITLLYLVPRLHILPTDSFEADGRRHDNAATCTRSPPNCSVPCIPERRV